MGVWTLKLGKPGLDILLKTFSENKRVAKNNLLFIFVFVNVF